MIQKFKQYSNQNKTDKQFELSRQLIGKTEIDLKFGGKLVKTKGHLAETKEKVMKPRLEKYER